MRNRPTGSSEERPVPSFETTGATTSSSQCWARALGELPDVVTAAEGAPEECRDRVPRVRRHLTGCRVVAGHDDDIGTERTELGDERVELLDRGDLARAVAVFASGVGVLEVEE